MATGLEERNAESIATARSNEREEATEKPELKRDGLFGVVADAKDKLAKDREAEQRSDARLRNEDYSWTRKVASNLAIVPGAVEGAFEAADYAFGDASGTEDAWYRATVEENLNKNETRKRFLRDWAAHHGEDAAKKLDEEDREFLNRVTVDQPKLLREQNFPTTRSREGGVISDFLGHTVNEGFENSPLYKADPKFWSSLQGSSYSDDIQKTYNKQYEFRRKLDFPVYGTFIEAHKIFTDEIEALVKKDASLMQGWEEDFLAMGAGTIEFLSQVAGMDDTQVGMTPWESRWKAGKMLTGGLLGTGIAALQPDRNNQVMGIALPNLARKPAILTAVVGPGIVRALSMKRGTALFKALEKRRAADPSFDAFMKRAERTKEKVARVVGESALGQVVKAVGDIPIKIPGTNFGSKIRDASPVIKEAGKKAAQYSEEVSGAIRQRKVADLAKSGAKGALYWSWSGAPQLGLIHPIVGTFAGTLLNSGKYVKYLDSVRRETSRSGDKATTDFELAEQVGQAESQIAQASGDARSTAAAFVLGLDQINEYGAQNVGGLSVLESPAYLEAIAKGEGVLGSDSIAGIPKAELILPPNANLPTRSATPPVKPPPPKGVEAFTAPWGNSLSSRSKIAKRVRDLTDDAKLLMWQAINKNLHKTNPQGFLEFLNKLPVTKQRFNQQYIRRVESDPKVQSLVRSTQDSVKSALDDLAEAKPKDPTPLPAQEPVAPQRDYDTSRYTMDLPDGDIVRIITEEAQILDNQAVTRDLVLAEARQIKTEIQNRIDMLEADDARAGTVVREALDEAAADRQPLFDVIEGGGRLPDPVDQVSMQWANRGRLKEIAHLKESLALVDDAAQEFLTGKPRVKPTVEEGYNLSQKGGSDFEPQRSAGSNAVVNTTKEILAMTLENKYLELVTDAWGKGGRGEVALQALYKNYGRVAVDNAIKQQRKMFLEGQTSKPLPKSKEARKTAIEATPAGQALDPRFPLTWDGAIIEGTPLATLAKEGGVPRRVVGRGRKGNPMMAPYAEGEYMARPRKPSDKPLTDESRKGEMTDYFTEAAKEVEGRPTKKQREFDEARALANKLKADRDAIFEGLDAKVAKKLNEEFPPYQEGMTFVSDRNLNPKQRYDAYLKVLKKTKDELVAMRRAEESGQKTKATTPEAKATTIDSPNRVRDAKRTAKEHPDLKEQGSAEIVFADKNGNVLATGYDRVVYGDHGPYIEFSPNQVNMEAFPRVQKKKWYDDARTSDGSVKLYMQKLDVSNLPNPPRTGKYSVRNNRAEGYADYKPGKYYISPDDVVTSKGAPARKGAPAVELPKKSKYAAKDQAKSNQANKFIGRGSKTSSTNAYAEAWGDRANSGSYTAKDVVFVSVEGSRKGRVKFDREELAKATKAGAEIITDNITDRKRSYNIGEREVAKFLEENKYKEVKPGVWQPDKKAPQRTVSRQEKITREDLQNNPDTVYLFGDNLQGKGKGGQAAAMRGEPNAAGIPTKKAPSTDDGAYFTDAELKQNKAAIDAAFDKIPADKNIVIPKAGLGTGLAQLQKRAPETFKYLQQKLAKLEGRKAEPANPWYRIEFEKAMKVPRNQRSKPMTDLARRIYRDPNIPIETKQKYWDAMIRGKTPHVSPNYGKPNALGGKPRTDAPTRYSTWHEQIKGFIKGDRVPESQAKTPGIVWQASKGSRRLGDQLTDDIARIENARELTTDQKLTALNDVRNNILDDIYEGRRSERNVYDFQEANYQSALGEVRLKGTASVVSRVGTAAINRAKTTGRTVADELAEFMGLIDTAVSRAKEASLKDPKSRASKAVIQARNVWNNKDVSGVTPGFIKEVRKLQAKVNSKDSLQLSAIAELEASAFKKNLPIHEQIALSLIAKRTVAASEAKAALSWKSALEQAREAKINRKAERNRIETAVSAVREATPVPKQPLPDLPPARPAPKSKAKPKAEEPAPKQPKKEIKERETQRGEEATVPTWVKDELNKRLEEFKGMGLSDTQAAAVTAGFVDVWNQGLTMLASEKARKIIYKKVLETIEADGVTLSKTFKENLEKQLNEYLSHFKAPFKGREKLAEYSLDLPGPESASGILEVALRTLPDEFMFTGDVWSGPVNVKQIFFGALNDMRKQKGGKKDLEVIQKEAFVELGNQFAAQVQVLAQNKIINGEMSRLGITRNSTPLEAAARVVVHRLLYQEAMPLGLFNRLTKEVVKKNADGVEVKGLSLEAVSMKDLADLIRTERPYMVEAVKAEINAARFENRGWKPLTEKQIRRMMLEQDGPLQGIADMLDKYEYRSKIAGAAELNSLFKDVIDPDGELLDAKPKAEQVKKDGYNIIDEDLNKTLDYTYNENWSDKVFNASFNPEYLDSLMFNARLAQNQGNFWGQFTSGMKGNITYESLMTNLGNGLGHSLVAGMLTGELPTTFYARVAHETWLYSKFRKNKDSRRKFDEDFARKYPERVEAYNDLYRFGSLDNVDWGSVEAAQAGPILAKGMKSEKAAVAGASKQLNAYRNLRRKIYQLEDNGPRIAEGVREHILISKELNMMEEGSFIVLPTGKKGMTIITKGKKPDSVNSTPFYRGNKNLTLEDLSKLKASYSMRKVSGRIFNYKDVPRFIKRLRAGQLGAVGAFFTPFISFPYLSVDIPGVKKGIFGSVLGDSLGNSSGFTNSPKLTAFRAANHAKQRMRVLMWGLNMNQFSHPLNSDLDQMTRFNMEPGGSTAAMIRSSDAPNTIGVWRWNNANIFETSMLVMRNIMALQSQLANSILGDKARSNKNIEYFMRLKAEGQVLTQNDIIRVGGISGNLFMRSILEALPKQSNQDKGWGNLRAAFGHIAASLIGVDDWNAIKTALPMATTGVGIKDSTLSSFAPMIRDLEETNQLNFEDMTPQEQLDFMTANWFKAFSRLYLRQRKITDGRQINNQARLALASFRKEMILPIEEKLKTARGAEKEQLNRIKTMALLSHRRLVEAYSRFYTAVSNLETLKRGRTKQEQKENTNLQRSVREVNNLRKSLEEARSKAVDALSKSRKQTSKSKELRSR